MTTLTSWDSRTHQSRPEAKCSPRGEPSCSPAKCKFNFKRGFTHFVLYDKHEGVVTPPQTPVGSRAPPPANPAKFLPRRIPEDHIPTPPPIKHSPILSLICTTSLSPIQVAQVWTRRKKEVLSLFVCSQGANIAWLSCTNRHFKFNNTNSLRFH